MDDQENTYYPVLDINISEVHFEKYITLKSSKGQTCTSLSCFYYNPQLGEWEPFIENFRMFIYTDSFGNKSCMTISTDRTLNINISDIVLQNLINVSKSWSSLQEQKHEVSDELFTQIDQYQRKEITKYSVDDALYKTRINRFNEVEKVQNVEDHEDDLAAPVSIINLTGVQLSIHKIEDEEDKNSFLGGNMREPEKVYQPIKVEFERGYNHIPHIELAKLHTGRHQLSQNIDDEVFYGVHLNKMQKVLTVRTFYTIHNQTIFTYVIRVYNDSMDEYIINPNEKLPIVQSMYGKK